MQAAKFSVKAEGLRAGKILREVGIFREESDLGAARDLVALLSEDACFAAGRINEPEDDLERGALARTVRSEQSVDFTGLNAQIEVAQRHDHFTLEGNRERLADADDGNGGFSHGEF